jgi:hypothetical protein
MDSGHDFSGPDLQRYEIGLEIEVKSGTIGPGKCLDRGSQGFLETGEPE